MNFLLLYVCSCTVSVVTVTFLSLGLHTRNVTAIVRVPLHQLHHRYLNRNQHQHHGQHSHRRVRPVHVQEFIIQYVGWMGQRIQMIVKGHASELWYHITISNQCTQLDILIFMHVFIMYILLHKYSIVHNQDRSRVLGDCEAHVLTRPSIRSPSLCMSPQHQATLTSKRLTMRVK